MVLKATRNQSYKDFWHKFYATLFFSNLVEYSNFAANKNA